MHSVTRLHRRLLLLGHQALQLSQAVLERGAVHLGLRQLQCSGKAWRRVSSVA